jgi:hypothetical protein
MELWNSWLMGEWGPAITAVIALASALSAILSSRSTSPLIQAALDIISVISLNFGSAKNADDNRG